MVNFVLFFKNTHTHSAKFSFLIMDNHNPFVVLSQVDTLTSRWVGFIFELNTGLKLELFPIIAAYLLLHKLLIAMTKSYLGLCRKLWSKVCLRFWQREATLMTKTSNTLVAATHLHFFCSILVLFLVLKRRNQVFRT